MGCKIEKAGLSDIVQELVASGVTSRSAVTEVLRTRHHIEIGEATVGRFLARLKSSAKSKAFQIISDHVDKVVPEDLAALENMEALAYGWAMEASIPQARRLASAASKIQENIELWRRLLLCDIDDPTKQIQTIIETCLTYVQEDAREQEQRLKAMRAAVNIIELKLSKAGLLDEDTKGKIVILSRKAVHGEESDDSTGASFRKTIPVSREALQ